MATIATVCGETTSEQLGKTLMHEHLVIGYPGFESDTIRRGPNADQRFAICVDRIQSLQDLGFQSMLDPCPNDLGRDVELAAKVAQRTGFQIICSTGLYKQAEGGRPYWNFRSNFGPQVDAMAELFIRELSEGIAETGIRAGIIKVATGDGQISDSGRSAGSVDERSVANHEVVLAHWISVARARSPSRWGFVRVSGGWARAAPMIRE